MKRWRQRVHGQRHRIRLQVSNSVRYAGGSTYVGGGTYLSATSPSPPPTPYPNPQTHQTRAAGRCSCHQGLTPRRPSHSQLPISQNLCHARAGGKVGRVRLCRSGFTGSKIGVAVGGILVVEVRLGGPGGLVRSLLLAAPRLPRPPAAACCRRAQAVRHELVDACGEQRLHQFVPFLAGVVLA